MAFQSSVRLDQTDAIVGEILEGGPTRAFPVLLSSTSAANNVIGRAFRYATTSSDTDVSADIATGAAFAGILAHPKHYTTSGPAAGTLEPTLTLPNETSVEVVDMGIMAVILSTTATIGFNVFYADATGILAAAAGTTLASHTLIPNCKVIRRNITTTGQLAIIQLTN